MDLIVLERFETPISVVLNTMFVLIIFIYEYYLSKGFISRLNHVSLMVFIWINLVLGVQIIGWSRTSILDFSYYYCIILAYMFGSHLPFLFNQKKVVWESIRFNSKNANFVLLIILYILIVLFFLATYEMVGHVFASGFSMENWAVIRKQRELSVYREENLFYTLFGTNSLIILPLLLYFRINGRFNGVLFYTLLTYILLVSISGFTRAPLLSFLVVVLISYRYIRQRALSGFFFFASILLLLGFFLISTSYLGDSDLGLVLIQDVLVYIYGGLAALSNVIHGSYYDLLIYDFGYYSFDFLALPLHRLDLIQSYPSLVREYDVTIPTNVYTFLDCFILDFGLLGGWIGTLLLGFFTSSVYLSVPRFGIFSLILYALLVYFIIFSFMNNEFIRFGTILFILKLVFIYLIVCVFVRPKSLMNA